ncbi:phenylacetate-CoA oxygenase subunit PaaJ [Ornithinimicrobium cryptoxanthini]|uniref:Phenylacetate-CoA oxygenase subunit PaaJ n=1 Tax=Ornithinimicrobium cryptoxanthini TaxID=2934161 RepID=A0ABY4YMU8_9MICO|nr:1,2-phenylacetyl-CoA epoxidase subunit PaaD [Ornithinimicrobium cryptoxanthini]USQ78069.1 phenylacetate-CoA oxygenase subunit PaaJ [Ornithinimicrobium cryptoxanthini]
MATVLTALQVAELEQQIRDIPDPEIPVISIDDLGIVRDISVDADSGLVRVTITPTYSGCPAVQAITDHISWTVRQQGLEALVDTTLSPAWTTDWMSEKGRESLRRFGIAPPSGTRPAGPVPVGLSVRQVACPTCGSLETEELSRFGGTACKALRRCLSCREPFEEFKAI